MMHGDWHGAIMGIAALMVFFCAAKIVEQLRAITQLLACIKASLESINQNTNHIGSVPSSLMSDINSIEQSTRFGLRYGERPPAKKIGGA